MKAEKLRCKARNLTRRGGGLSTLGLCRSQMHTSQGAVPALLLAGLLLISATSSGQPFQVPLSAGPGLDTLRSAGPESIGPESTVLPVAGAPFGINAHIPSAALLDEVAAAGIGWVRIDFVWAFVEPEEDVYDWSLYDAVVADAAERNIKIFATLAYTPAWATVGEPMSGQPSSPDDWQEICYLAASRYRGRIHAWGLWNEPNLEHFWSSTVGGYVVLIVERGAAAIRMADPDALICGPDLAHLISADWDSWLDKVLYRTGHLLDVVTHHVYPDEAGHGDVTRDLDRGSSYPWDPPSVKQVLRDRGWGNMPFWLTETGVESGEWGEAAQAGFYESLLEDWFSGNRELSWMHRIFFYEIADHVEVPEITYGIVEVGSQMRRKPAWEAFRDFISSAKIDHAEPVLKHLPSVVRPSEQVTVTVRMRNSGSTTWTPAGGYRLELMGDADGWDMERAGAYLDRNVPPGATFTFTPRLTPPPLPPDVSAAEAVLRWQMGRQGRSRLGDPLRWQVTMTDEQPVIIERQPVDWIGPARAEVRLGVEATSPSQLSYRWLRNSLELDERYPFEGTTGPILTIHQADETTAGEYLCVVSNAAGQALTQPARVVIEEDAAAPRRPFRRIDADTARKLLADLLKEAPPRSLRGGSPGPR